MKNRRKLLFFIALGTLVLVSFFTIWRMVLAHSSDMSCSTKVIMYFEDTEMQSVNANVHFRFSGQGKGSIVVEGYTHSAEGALYLQRYVKFDYTSTRISSMERAYRIKSWIASKSSIDQSPDVIFDYFMREMSDSLDGLLLTAERVNEKIILLSSLSSPLFICPLNPIGKAG